MEPISLFKILALMFVGGVAIYYWMKHRQRINKIADELERVLDSAQAEIQTWHEGSTLGDSFPMISIRCNSIAWQLIKQLGDFNCRCAIFDMKASKVAGGIIITTTLDGVSNVAFHGTAVREYTYLITRIDGMAFVFLDHDIDVKSIAELMIVWRGRNIARIWCRSN